MESQSQLSVYQLEVMIRRLDGLRTFPAVVTRLLELMTSQDQSRLTEVLSCDPSLSALILSRANFTFGEPISNIDRAVEVLGIDTIRSIVMAVEVFTGPDVEHEGQDRADLWKHSLAVAIGAKMISERLGESTDAAEAYVCGLLHDLGKLVLDHCMPKSYQRVLAAARKSGGGLIECEQRILGIEHSMTGRRLAEHWRLPRAVREVIWFCHQPVEALPQAVSNCELVAIVALADTLAREQRIGFSGNISFHRSSAELAERLGLSRELLKEIADGLGEAVQKRFDLLGLQEVTPDASYREALTGANIALGKTNEQLARKVDELTGQASAFRYLHDFSSDLTSDATVSDVLEGITAVMCAAIGCQPTFAEPIIAYSVGGQGDMTLLACRGDHGELSWRTFPPPAESSDNSAPGSAAEAIAILSSEPGDLYDWIDRSSYAHQPFVCAGEWIGGVFYQAASLRKNAQVVHAVTGELAMALGVVQARSRAVILGEQLTGAFQVLADTQDALADAKALSTVGEMAAGAAHELNTPLAIISGRAQLMRNRAPDEQDKKIWSLITDQAQQISDIISELMAFASPPPPQSTDFKAAKLLKSAAEAFSREYPQAVSCHVDIQIEDEAFPIHADREQIRGVMVELLINAANALVSQACISLGAESGEDGKTVLLTVRDTGCGMDEQTVNRAFTPFFSSQKAGRRRGLGLSRAKRIVENNAGTIRVKSRLGKGTVVYVQLPAVSHR